ncbi:MAG: hypothetical protein AB7G75_23390 [Candidatus Binatia bacterium]
MLLTFRSGYAQDERANLETGAYLPSMLSVSALVFCPRDFSGEVSVTPAQAATPNDGLPSASNAD